MANSISLAVKYIKTPEALEKVLNKDLKTLDLRKPCIVVDASTVKYQHLEFSSATPSTYSRDAGYTNNALTITWKTIELTQDVGNSLYIDRMDDEEAAGYDIIRIANNYIGRVQNPFVDTYTLKTIASAAGIKSDISVGKGNIVDVITNARAAINNQGYNSKNFILYLDYNKFEMLKQAAMAQGRWALGSWNGSENEIELFDGIKVVGVPATYFDQTNTKTYAVLMLAEAAAQMVKYQEGEFFDKIPGFGGRKQEVDIGLYFDAIVYSELSSGIVNLIYSSATNATTTPVEITGTVVTESASL